MTSDGVLTVVAALGGFGFVAVAVLVNVAYIRGGLPVPGAGKGVDETVEDYAGLGRALRGPAVPAPASWVFLTLFAAGMFAVLWAGGAGAGAWALVGFAGVVLQNATFAAVEALRFAVAEAATRGRDAAAGLWVLSAVLFGFNQVFLATALLGFTAAGAAAGLMPLWHVVLGYGSAGLLFLSASATPYTVRGAAGRFGVVGLVGWLGWIVWIVVSAVALLGR